MNHSAKVHFLAWSIGVRWIISSSKHWLFSERYDLPYIDTELYLWALERSILPCQVKYDPSKVSWY